MCGIVGFLDPKRDTNSSAIALSMAEALALRGPDDAGAWEDSTSGLAFAHRRLSILDLSPAGHQPMLSASGRFVITYNGEVYNFQDIKQELEPLGYTFRGGSDTEVMLAAFEHWGVAASIPRFNGMFAFAVFDREAQMLHLVRDRAGIKPLYYGWNNGCFLFASELKAFWRHPKFKAEVNRDAVHAFVRYGYVPAPFSIYTDIKKLIPGTILSFPVASTSSATTLEPQEFWSFSNVAQQGTQNLLQGDDQEVLSNFTSLLADATRLRTISDVPIGAFLSGGIDSSTVVAVLQSQMSKPVNTFTIAFHEDECNEGAFAKKVAHHLGTNHTELYLTAQDALQVVPELPALYDEPFADASQIPTYLVCKLASQHVTVALSGDGGDELFGGYNRYTWASRTWNATRFLPQFMRDSLAKGIRNVPVETWDAITNPVLNLLPARLRVPLVGDKLHKISSLLAAHSPEEIYYYLISRWHLEQGFVKGVNNDRINVINKSDWNLLTDYMSQMSLIDGKSYLPDDILAKVDRASMGVSLEARVPLIDYRLIEFAWKLPRHFKLRNGETKWLLRQVLYQHVPRELVDRPKMGFFLPIAVWLRGPLRAWAEELLNEQVLEADGFFSAQIIRHKWEEHLSGKRNWLYDLWPILMFQAWYNHFHRSAFAGEALPHHQIINS